MRKLKALLVVLFAFSAISCASTSAQQARHEQLSYLEYSSIQLPDFTPAPAPDSPADKADFATLHEWQDKRTPAQCDKAQSQANAYFEEFYGDLNPFVSPLPKDVSVFLRKVHHDTDEAVSILKKRNNRPRPFRRDDTLNPCLGRINGLAYPSGHSTIVHVFGRILSDLDPARKDEYMKRADECALNRVIGGVHHPTDIEAGAKLADIVYEQFKKNPEFIKELEALRSDLKH